MINFHALQIIFSGPSHTYQIKGDAQQREESAEWLIRALLAEAREDRIQTYLEMDPEATTETAIDFLTIQDSMLVSGFIKRVSPVVRPYSMREVCEILDELEKEVCNDRVSEMDHRLSEIAIQEASQN